jgi:ribosomal protein S18 acetylase RimI-like enzyme
VTVSLRPMTDGELAPLVERWSARFAGNLVTARGVSPRAARQQAVAEFADLLPDGVRTAGQLLFIASDEGEDIGALWLSTSSPDGAEAGWICEIEVDEARRGRGYGRSIVLLAEQECVRRGISEIRLHVFGSNTVARALYESLGYDVLSLKMAKRL